MRVNFASRTYVIQVAGTVSEGSRDNSHEDEAFTEGKVQQIVNRCKNGRPHTSLRRVNSARILLCKMKGRSSNLNAVCILCISKGCYSTAVALPKHVVLAQGNTYNSFNMYMDSPCRALPIKCT